MQIFFYYVQAIKPLKLA